MANADEKEYNGRKNQGRLQCVSEIVRRPSGLRENAFEKKRIYYEAIIHNPEGDMVPDEIDDRLKKQIKDVYQEIRKNKP